MSGRRSLALRRAALAASLGLLLVPHNAPAQRPGTPPAPASAPQPYRLGVRLGRGVVKLGEPVRYRGWITGGNPGRVRFLAPDSGGAFTWGPVRAVARTPRGKATEAGADGMIRFADFDTVFVEATLQAFAIGDLTVPGLEFELDDGATPRTGRLPVAKLIVAPLVTAADTSAQLRALRGPLAAPWWERVPWRTVAIAAAALLALAGAILWWVRRRRRAPALAPAVERDPATHALAELEALRRVNLPARGRFAEHAFQLGRIVRRFLEATAGTPLPGDTTPEFVGHLEAARLAQDDLERIGTLMRFWDTVKFARAEESVEEAARAEQAVESLVRRLAPRKTGAETGAAPGATPGAGRAA